MASRLAAMLIGEAGETPPPSTSIAADWFNELGSEVQQILVDGNVDNLELQKTALLVKDKPVKAGDDYGTWDEFTERVASWEEAQNPDLEGNWEVVHDSGQPHTAFSLYVHRKDEGATHIEDFKTFEEAETKGNALAALLGVELFDFTPADQAVQQEAYSNQFISALVRKALKPYLHIQFLDGDREEIFIKLEWIKDAYTTGLSWHPGLVPKPTRSQLRQIGGPIGKVSGGEFAMEVIYNHRYEGDDNKGVLHDDPEEMELTRQETPDMYYRPLRCEYRNEGEPPEELYT